MVNQRANGLYFYRMHDDLWLWDPDNSKVANGWTEMNTHAKTSPADGQPKEDRLSLSRSAFRSFCSAQGRFLKCDSTESRFLFNQADVDLYIAEMRRQLASTKSFMNAYNKYATFFMRNFGGPSGELF